MSENSMDGTKGEEVKQKLKVVLPYALAIVQLNLSRCISCGSQSHHHERRIGGTGPLENGARWLVCTALALHFRTAHG